MPLELWVQAAAMGFKIIELPVPLVYLEEARSFGGSLDNAEIRLGVYREVLRKSMEQWRAKMVGEKGTGAFCRNGPEAGTMRSVGRRIKGACPLFPDLVMFG